MNYPYANGVIATIDEHLFDTKKLSKLIGLNNKDFIKTLSDMNYGDGGNTVEELIQSELGKVKKLINEISPNKEHTNLFFLFNDLSVIKAYFKMKYFKIDSRVFSNPLGNVSSDDLLKAVNGEGVENLDKDYQVLFKTINKMLEDLFNSEELGAKEFSVRIDKAVFKFINNKLRFTNHAALKIYFRTYLDFKNLISFIRARRLNWELDAFKLMFIDYGTIKLDVYEDLYLRDQVQVVRRLEDFYGSSLRKALTSYYETENLDNLERSLDELLLEKMREFKNDSFGIGPMIYYYLIKETEAKNIKLIYGSSNLDLTSLIDY